MNALLQGQTGLVPFARRKFPVTRALQAAHKYIRLSHPTVFILLIRLRKSRPPLVAPSFLNLIRGYATGMNRLGILREVLPTCFRRIFGPSLPHLGIGLQWSCFWFDGF